MFLGYFLASFVSLHLHRMKLLADLCSARSLHCALYISLLIVHFTTPQSQAHNLSPNTLARALV